MVTERKKLKLIHKTQGEENISMGNHQCVNLGRQTGRREKKQEILLTNQKINNKMEIVFMCQNHSKYKWIQFINQKAKN